mmetsp:Transcript_2114/g.4400  ORF Transcript_2114/g.4400 Transcript_2114/m.4400 type:complete len:221 (+) Transcript_2114:328-990(+)
MNIYFTATIATLAALSNTRALPASVRGLRPGGGASGAFGASRPAHDICFWATNNSQPLLDGIENLCSTTFDCAAVDTDALDCNVWETNDILAFEKPTCSEDMTDEEKEAFREEMEDIREEMFDAIMLMTDEERAAFHAEQESTDAANAATVLGCGCCNGMDSISELVKGREGAVAKALKLHPGNGGQIGGGSSFGGGSGMGGKGRPEGSGKGGRGGPGGI